MTEDHLSRLRAAVAGLPSGTKLITALVGAPETKTEHIELITTVVTEAKTKGAAANASATRTADLSTATSVISQLSFILPRYQLNS